MGPVVSLESLPASAAFRLAAVVLRLHAAVPQGRGGLPLVGGGGLLVCSRVAPPPPAHVCLFSCLAPSAGLAGLPHTWQGPPRSLLPCPTSWGVPCEVVLLPPSEAGRAFVPLEPLPFPGSLAELPQGGAANSPRSCWSPALHSPMRASAQSLWLTHSSPQPLQEQLCQAQAPQGPGRPQTPSRPASSAQEAEALPPAGALVVLLPAFSPGTPTPPPTPKDQPSDLLSQRLCLGLGSPPPPCFSLQPSAQPTSLGAPQSSLHSSKGVLSIWPDQRAEPGTGAVGSGPDPVSIARPPPRPRACAGPIKRPVAPGSCCCS